MRITRFFASLCLLLCSALPVHSAIYGSDDREDITPFHKFREVARAVAVMTGSAVLTEVSETHYEAYDPGPLSDYVCQDERFSQQTSYGLCTAFLIGPKLLATAGHCVLATEVVENTDGESCKNLRWIFDHNQSGNSDLFHIPKKDVYGCRSIIRGANLDSFSSEPGNHLDGPDYALIELDREVEGIRPIPIAWDYQLGDSVATLGHGLGLPAKFSGFSPVLRRPLDRLGQVNLDSHSGNSGGPVINALGEVVGILISGHDHDLYQKDFEGCERYNRCDQSGKNCSLDARMQLSNSFTSMSFLRPFIVPE